MPKYNSLQEYIDTFNKESLRVYKDLSKIILSINDSIDVKLFAGQVAFFDSNTLKRTFHSSPVIVMSFFDDHVNIFASGNKNYKSVLPEYKFTEKYTLQINYNTALNDLLLLQLFKDSLK